MPAKPEFPDSPRPPTVASWTSRARRQLESAGFDSGETEARRIAESVLRLRSGGLWLQADRVLTREETIRLDDLVRSRSEGVPIQYLTQRAAFRNLDLIVGPGVFIPRPETEGLVDHVLKFLRSLGGAAVAEASGAESAAPPTRLSPRASAGPSQARPAHPEPTPALPLVLDLCSGTGALLAAILSEFPGAKGVAVEASRLALDFTRRNLDRAGLARRAEAMEGDLFSPLSPGKFGGAFQVVVSNPPYIPEEHWQNLPRDVRDFEPRLALLGGRDGLSVVRRIVAGAAEYLADGGLLAIEIDESHGDRVRGLLESTGEFDEIGVEPDLAGKPRYCLARTRLARTRRRSRSMRDGRWSSEA